MYILHITLTTFFSMILLVEAYLKYQVFKDTRKKAKIVLLSSISNLLIIAILIWHVIIIKP